MENEKQAQQCRCFIRHATTVADRKAVSDRFDEARKTGDTTGIKLAMAMLSPCPSEVKS